MVSLRRDGGALLEMQGFAAVRIATQGRTDGGIDIIALRKSNATTWLVQAKCYAQDRPVGPDIIREMLGSLQGYTKRYPDQKPAGMVVTTSKFTGEAQRIALAHGVRLIDGANLRASAAAENKRAAAGGAAPRLRRPHHRPQLVDDRRMGTPRCRRPKVIHRIPLSKPARTTSSACARAGQQRQTGAVTVFRISPPAASSTAGIQKGEGKPPKAFASSLAHFRPSWSPGEQDRKKVRT